MSKDGYAGLYLTFAGAACPRLSVHAPQFRDETVEQGEYNAISTPQSALPGPPHTPEGPLSPFTSGRGSPPTYGRFSSSDAGAASPRLMAAHTQRPRRIWSVQKVLLRADRTAGRTSTAEYGALCGTIANKLCLAPRRPQPWELYAEGLARRRGQPTELEGKLQQKRTESCSPAHGKQIRRWS